MLQQSLALNGIICGPFSGVLIFKPHLVLGKKVDEMQERDVMIYRITGLWLLASAISSLYVAFGGKRMEPLRRPLVMLQCFAHIAETLVKHKAGAIKLAGGNILLGSVLSAALGLSALS